ncbi:MAG: hypothetical protein AABY22_06730, partial [Nanoarchaeota archaeon]
SSNGQETEWTMLPPVAEEFSIPSLHGVLDYRSIICNELMEKLQSESLGLNPEALRFLHTNFSVSKFNLINDGSHRIHYGFEKGGIKLLFISNVTPGFPYYAAPQLYSNVRVYPKITEELEKVETKVHIIEPPGHKNLYRLFPSGGIKSGVVRPDKKLKD